MDGIEWDPVPLNADSDAGAAFASAIAEHCGDVSKEEVLKVATALYASMSGRRLSGLTPRSETEFCCDAVPPLDAEETAARMRSRHLQNVDRAGDHVSDLVFVRLRCGYDALIEADVDRAAATECLFRTWCIWRLGGNTEAWMDRVGFLERWDRGVQEQVVDHWRACFDRKELADSCLGRGLMPSRMLRSCAVAKNREHYHELIDLILATADTMVSKVQGTLLKLAPLDLPWEIYCHMFAGLPFFGVFGFPGPKRLRSVGMLSEITPRM